MDAMTMIRTNGVLVPWSAAASVPACGGGDSGRGSCSGSCSGDCCSVSGRGSVTGVSTTGLIGAVSVSVPMSVSGVVGNS